MVLGNGWFRHFRANNRAEDTGNMLAGIAQLALVWSAAAKAGFPLRLRAPVFTPGMGKLVRIAIPAALAGGVLLAVYGDYRVMPRGPYKTGLNEVKIGLVVPETPFWALRRLVGSEVAAELVLGGEMIASERAAAIGLVDELVDSPEAAVAAALAWCERHLELPRDAMLATRAMARRDLRALFEGENAAHGDRFIDFWFSEDTQRRLRALVASLGKR